MVLGKWRVAKLLKWKQWKTFWETSSVWYHLYLGISMLTILLLFFLQLIPAFLEVEEVSLCLILYLFLNKCEISYIWKRKIIRWETSAKSIMFHTIKQQGSWLLLDYFTSLDSGTADLGLTKLGYVILCLSN